MADKSLITSQSPLNGRRLFEVDIRSYHFLPTKFAYNWIQIDVFDRQMT